MSAAARRVWGWPLVIGGAMASGLVSALVADGWGDRWSWIALGVPLAAMTWLAVRRSPPSTDPTRPDPSRETP